MIMKKYLICVVSLVFLLTSCKTKKSEYVVPDIEFSSDLQIKRILVNGVGVTDNLKENKLSYPLREDKMFYNIFYSALDADGEKIRRQITVYTEPKESIDVSIKGNDISFSGEKQRENEFLEQYDGVFAATSDYTIYKKAEEKMVSFLDSLGLAASGLLEKQKSNLDPKFVEFIKKDIIYRIANQKESYEGLHKYISKNKDYKVSEAFYDYRKQIPLEDEEAFLYLASYNIYFRSILLNDIEDRKLGTIFEKLDNTIKSTDIKLAFKAKQLHSDIGYYGINEETQKYYDQYINTPGAKVDGLKKLYAKKLKIAHGTPAPNFKAYDVDGKEVSLSDFKDKLVYVDIWATWCGPCIGEIPSLIELEKEYHKNKDVVFMSVSLDSDVDEDAWKKMIKDKGLGGVQLRARDTFDSEIAKNYQVTGLPTFLLIKDGKIISSQAPRPSHGDKIRDLINKNI